MLEIDSVAGNFMPAEEQPRSDRVYGTLQTHDAKVRIGFESARVPLPALAPAEMLVSGKVWLEENTSGVILMVREYRVLASEARKVPT